MADHLDGKILTFAAHPLFSFQIFFFFLFLVLVSVVFLLSFRGGKKKKWREIKAVSSTASTLAVSL